MKKYRKTKTKADLNPKTEKLYISRMRSFVEFCGRHPEDVGVKEINAFLCDQAERHSYSAITQNQIRSAIVWMYVYVLRRDIEAEGKIIRAKRSHHMPTVHRHETVMQVLGLLDPKYRLIGQLMYGAGLSPLECMRLRIEDIKFDLQQISVRGASGIGARKTVLPDLVACKLQYLIDDLHQQWKIEIAEGFGFVRTPNKKKITDAWPLQWLFPANRRYLDLETGKYLRHHLNETVIQKALRKASIRADVPVAIAPKDLRVAFAASLLTGGANVRTVQEAIGHKNVKNTMEISRACGHNIKGVISPVDALAG